ncbi:MAG: hypothetical protein IPO28_15560 [Holophagaceae bacterium]|nr:hypothetical protein [Holophagaceae bacterium]
MLSLWLLQEARLALPEAGPGQALLIRWALVVRLIFSSLSVLFRVTGIYGHNYLGDAAEVLRRWPMPCSSSRR